MPVCGENGNPKAPECDSGVQVAPRSGPLRVLKAPMYVSGVPTRRYHPKVPESPTRKLRYSTENVVEGAQGLRYPFDKAAAKSGHRTTSSPTSSAWACGRFLLKRLAKVGQGRPVRFGGANCAPFVNNKDAEGVLVNPGAQIAPRPGYVLVPKAPQSLLHKKVSPEGITRRYHPELTDELLHHLQ